MFPAQIDDAYPTSANETLHLRSDKVFLDEARVELQGEGGRVLKIQVPYGDTLKRLDLSR